MCGWCWSMHKWLILNSEKTEFLWTGTNNSLKSLTSSNLSVSIDSYTVIATNSARLLGVLVTRDVFNCQCSVFLLATSATCTMCDCCWDNAKYVHYGLIGDIETVSVQSDARVARRGFTQQCNSSGAVQISHFHSLIACRLWRPVHPLLCVKKQRKVSIV